MVEKVLLPFKTISLNRLTPLWGFIFLLGFSVSFLNPSRSVAQCTGTETFDYTGGFQTFFVPANVTSITVEAWGGGGAGADAFFTSTGGGGSGAYEILTLTVSPGEPLGVFVGQGGVGSGADGGQTYVTRDSNSPISDAILVVNGGSGAPDGGFFVGDGGEGGTVFTYSGIPASDFGPRTQLPGTDGGDAGFSGIFPVGGDGADAPSSGGTGGAGSFLGNGGTGNVPGGGGGGTAGVGSSGGAGGNGRVIITYTCATIPCGTILDDGAISGTTVIEFTSDCTWDAPEGLSQFEVLAIGGGAGGGGRNDSGGGGAGGIVQATAVISDPDGLPAGTSYDIVIGSGGSGGTSTNNDASNGGNDGDQTSFDLGGTYEIIAGGGGGGASQDRANAGNGGVSSIASTTGFTSSTLVGGSGGGQRRTAGSAGSGSVGGGNGGAGANSGGNSGGGGGGSAGPGSSASGNDGGDGGDGLQFSSFDLDQNRFFSAGGGGGGNALATGGSGSSGGDGGSQAGSNAGQNANSPGSGGGGSRTNGATGGNGADGIVFIRFDNFRILPVEYAYFEARYQSTDRQAELLWGTSSEWENSHFDIERSINNVSSWESIGRVEGQGYSEVLVDYLFIDKNLPVSGGNIFYRLKQNDFNGDFSYSETRGIQVEPLSGTKFWRVYPNPTDGDPFTIAMLNPEDYRDEPITLSVISMSGAEQSWSIVNPVTMGQLAGQYLLTQASGVYLIRITWGDRTETHRVILEK